MNCLDYEYDKSNEIYLITKGADSVKDDLHFAIYLFKLTIPESSEEAWELEKVKKFEHEKYFILYQWHLALCVNLVRRLLPMEDM